MSKISKLLIFMFISILLFASASADTIYLNGTAMKVRAFKKNGVLYAPVSAFTTSLKTYNAWYPDVKAVLFNGRYFQSWFLHNGEMYLPVREISYAVGGYFKETPNGDVYISATPETTMAARNAAPLRSQSMDRSNTMPKISPLNVGSAKYTPKFPQRTEPKQTNTIYSFEPSYSGSNSTNYVGVAEPRSKNMETTYIGSNEKGGGVVNPLHAQGALQNNITLPPNPQYSGVPTPDTGFSTQLSRVPSYAAMGAFEPVTAKNQTYSITVTNIEEVSNIKNVYSASAGSKYWIVYISQQNISSEAQIYTGKFTIVDEQQKVYDYLEGLSNYWLAILKPGGVNYGYLVFEVPVNAKATRLVLNALSQPPLSIALNR